MVVMMSMSVFVPIAALVVVVVKNEDDAQVYGQVDNIRFEDLGEHYVWFLLVLLPSLLEPVRIFILQVHIYYENGAPNAQHDRIRPQEASAGRKWTVYHDLT